MGCFRRFRRLNAISSASTVGCFRCYINLLRRPKAIQCLMDRAPLENQFRVWMVMLVGCMSLFMVGDDRWLSAFLYLLHDQQKFHFSDCITHVWFPSVVFERLILWGGFLSPTHACSVRDWCKRGCKSCGLERPLLSRWLCVSVDVAF